MNLDPADWSEILVVIGTESVRPIVVAPEAIDDWEDRNRALLRTAPAVERSLRERARDARWSRGLTYVTDDDNQAIQAGLVFLCPLYAAIGDRNLQAELAQIPEASSLHGPELAILGNMHRLQGGASTVLTLDGPNEEHLVEAVFARTVQYVSNLERRPVALFVPEGQRNVLEASPARPSAVRPASPNARLEGISKFSDWEQFAQSHSKAVRHTLRRDYRRLAARQVSVERPATLATLLDSADLIAQVKRRNGIDDSARLTQMRLRAEYGAEFGEASSSDEYVAWVLPGEDGQPIGYCLAAISVGHMSMIEIGLADDSPTRRDDYLLLEVFAPVQHAIERGIDMINLGPGHLEPKLARGARPEANFHLVW